MFTLPPLRSTLAALTMGLAATASQADITVTSLLITGPTTLVQDGPKGTYTATFSGTGAGRVLGTNVRWSVYEVDEYFDDLLIGESNSINVSDDASGVWTLSVTFELWCQGQGACYVTGKDGQDDEASGTWGAGNIGVHLETWSGSNIKNASEYLYGITCVPEPETAGLAIAGLGVAGLSLRRGQRTARTAA